MAGRPYRDRRDLLTPLIPNGSWFLCPPAFPGADFDAVLAASAANGLEGVVAKRLDSRYEPGVRSGDWLKVKNVLRQEVVVAGWKPGKGNRTGQVGSLLVGVYSDQGPMPGEVGGGKEGPMPGEVGGGKEGPMPGEVGGGKEGPMPGEVGGGKEGPTPGEVGGEKQPAVLRACRDRVHGGDAAHARGPAGPVEPGWQPV